MRWASRLLSGQEFSVTCSAGISLYPRDGNDAETLLRNADAAMYRAKAGGRNNFQFYKAEMNRNVSERLSMEHNLRRALERLEFELHYQPRIDLRRRTMVGAEGLVRWRHPTAGLVYSDRFIPIAEETGLIVPLGECVMHTACAQNHAWQTKGYDPISVSVNLSLRQFNQQSLVRSVQRMLVETGLAAAHLEVELTESMVMHDAEGAITILQVLCELGMHVAVDDFGTGYSSLSYLKRLPLAALKIDQAFVRDICESHGDRGVLAQAIIALGHNLRLRVIAEGVEKIGAGDLPRAARLRRSAEHVFQPPGSGRPVRSFACVPARSGRCGRLNDTLTPAAWTAPRDDVDSRHGHACRPEAGPHRHC